MDCSVFARIRRADNDVRVEEFGIPDRHASFNAVSFGFNGWCNHAPVGAVIRCYDKGFATEEGIGLLFDGGKAGIEVNVHDQGLVAVDGKWHSDHSRIFYECFLHYTAALDEKQYTLRICNCFLTDEGYNRGMCGRYGFSVKNAKDVYERFDTYNELSDFQPRYNIAPGQ
jgi:hypothetical protein